VLDGASYKQIGDALIVASGRTAESCIALRFHQNPENTMWKKALLCLIYLMSLGLAACNTVEGAGRDVEHLGQDIHDEAQEHKHY